MKIMTDPDGAKMTAADAFGGELWKSFPEQTVLRKTTKDRKVKQQQGSEPKKNK